MVKEPIHYARAGFEELASVAATAGVRVYALGRRLGDQAADPLARETPPSVSR